MFKGTDFGHQPANLQLVLFSRLVVFIFHSSVVTVSSLLCTAQLYIGI